MSLVHGGILLFNLKTGEEMARFFVDSGSRIGLVNDDVFEFHLAPDSVFWAASAGGLLKIDPRQQTFFSNETAEFKANSIGKIRAVLSSTQKKETKWVLTNADRPPFLGKENFS